MPSTAAKLMTVEEFFVWQQGQEDRYELVEGLPVRRVIVSTQHDRIVVNTLVALHGALADGPYRVATANIGIRTKTANYRRPDLSVASGTPQHDSYENHDPRLVVEMLSPTDCGLPLIRRIEEFRQDARVRSLLLIDTLSAQATLIRRDGPSWTHDDFDGRESVIPLSEINCSLAMAEVYEGVRFADAD